MKSLFYCGLGFSSFALIQLVSFLGTAYPGTRVGVILFLILIATLVSSAGLINWVGLYLKGWSASKETSLAGWTPAIVLGIIYLVAIIFGIYAGL